MSDESPHQTAGDLFAEQAVAQYGDSIRHLVVFGSTARGDTDGVHSDVDVFVVLETGSNESRIRNLAYDIGLDYGVVFSVHTLSADRFKERTDHPFVQTVFEEGRSYV